jgi:hypothetical protein
MQNLYNEAIPFGGTGGQFCGKNKGVLLTATANGTVQLFTYRANGTTAATSVNILANNTHILPIRVWGVSCGAIAGFTGAVLA